MVEIVSRVVFAIVMAAMLLLLWVVAIAITTRAYAADVVRQSFGFFSHSQKSGGSK